MVRKKCEKSEKEEKEKEKESTSIEEDIILSWRTN